MGQSREGGDGAAIDDLGAAGIGKSTFIRNLCKENEIGFIDVRLTENL